MAIHKTNPATVSGVGTFHTGQRPATIIPDPPGPGVPGPTPTEEVATVEPVVDDSLPDEGVAAVEEVVDDSLPDEGVDE